MLASGGWRLWKDRHQTGPGQSAEKKLILADLPLALGPWRAESGAESEATLEPEIARIAGCDDHIIRCYVNEQTGVKVVALVLSGRPELLSQHTPEYCFPATGYRLVGEPSMHMVHFGPKSAQFWEALYVRGRKGAVERQVVQFSFRHAGRWSPDSAETSYAFRTSPNMLKVQIQRLASEPEWLGEGDPGAEFLSHLLPEIESRIVGGGPG